MDRQKIKFITSLQNMNENNLTDRLLRIRNANQQNNHTQVSDSIILQTPNHEKTYERQKQARKKVIKNNEYLKEIEEIWKSREDDSKKQDSGQIKKSSELDTLVAIAIILILFCLALHLAPFQFIAQK